MITTVKVEDKTLKKLRILKAKYGFSSYDTLIWGLMHYQKTMRKVYYG